MLDSVRGHKGSTLILLYLEFVSGDICDTLSRLIWASVRTISTTPAGGTYNIYNQILLPQ